MNSLLPESDREFILNTMKDSEHRQARRIGMVLERVDGLSNRLDAVEEHVIKKGSVNARTIAISAGTIVSVVTGVVGWLIERFL